MKRNCTLTVLMALLFSTGCGIETRQPLEKQTFLLNIQQPADTAALNTGLCITVLPCRVAAPYSGRSLVYRTGTVEYEQDAYNLFLTAPDAQITEAMSQWFCRTAPAGSDNRAKITLLPEIDALYADFRDTEKPLAVAEMHITFKQADKIWTRLIRAETPLPAQPAAAEVVEALSQSMTDILTKLTDYLNTTYTDQ